jgi:hypothetical protein
MAVVSSIVVPPEHLLEMPQACCSESVLAEEAPKKGRRASAPSGDDEGFNSLIVAKSVRALLTSIPLPVNCGAEVPSAINARLRRLLLEAASRAHENGRKTLKPSDL